jgi:hypothetical protein
MARQFQWMKAIENGAIRESHLSERELIKRQDGI